MKKLLIFVVCLIGCSQTQPVVNQPIKIIERVVDHGPEIAELRARIDRLRETDEISPIKKDLDQLRENVTRLNQVIGVDADLAGTLIELKKSINNSFLNLNTRMEQLELKEERYEYRLRNLENMVVGSVADPAFQLKKKGKH